MKFLFRTNVIQKMFCPEACYNSGSRRLLLTFDDGPSPLTTPPILDILSESKVFAIFFVTGVQASNHPEICQRIVKSGHSLGLHSMNHQSYLGSSVDAITSDCIELKELLMRKTGVEVNFVRPPYGFFGPSFRKAARLSGLQPVLWNLSVHDYRLDNPDVLRERLTRNQKAGDIILLHDNSPCASHLLAMLPEYISSSRNSGLEFVSSRGEFCP